MVIYVLGANGMAGSMIVKRFHDLGHETVGIYRQELDITHRGWEEKLSLRLRTDDIVINCIGLIPQKLSQDSKNNEKYIYCNGTFPHELAKLCESCSVRLIHLSTNCVFKTGNKSEDDIPDADDMYGLSKMAGEPVDKALVIRCSIIGPERNTSVSLMNWALSQTTLCGYTNHVWNGITTLELANQIHHIILEKSRSKGLLHLFSKDTLSKYELIKEIYRIWNHNGTLIPSQTESPYDKTITSKYFTSENTIQMQLLELWNYIHIHRLEKPLHQIPYPHMVQENYLEEDFATSLQKEILSLPIDMFDRYENPFEAKFTLRDKFNLPTELNKLFAYWTSEQFHHELSSIIGIPLLNDPTRNFYGVHLYNLSDKLDIHVDAGLHPTTKQKKQVTVGLYLSSNYKDGDGCELELWSGTSAGQENPTLHNCIKRVVPLFNRLIVFVNTDTSWHGNPTPLAGTMGCKRIFITISFLSENYTDINCRMKAYFVKRPGDTADAEQDRLRLLRADSEKYKEVYRTALL